MGIVLGSIPPRNRPESSACEEDFELKSPLGKSVKFGIHCELFCASPTRGKTTSNRSRLSEDTEGFTK